MNESLKLKGHLEIINADTKEVLVEGDNLIVNTGIGLVGSRIVKGVDDFLDYIAIGNDNTEANVLQTSLENETFRKKMTDKDGGGTSAFFRGEVLILGNEAIGLWREYGMFNASSGGIMFNRITKEFNHASGTNVIVRFTITMERAE